MGKKHTTSQRKNWKLIILGLVIGLPAGAYAVWRITFRSPDLPLPPLKSLAEQRNIELGVHVQLSRLHDPVYPNVVSSQFGFATIDGEAHWRDTRPDEGVYDYSQADEVARFAENRGMPLQVHHLIWGERAWLPDWLKKGDYTPAQLRQMQKDYITKTVSHYKGRVKEWSVVNETYSRAEHHYNLRDWWADHMQQTEADMDNYFRWARQADPQATLLINDFDNEVQNSVSNKIYAYVKAAKARGVPIDGIGMQMHVNAARPLNKDEVIKNMQRFAAIGVPTYVTEFDVNVNSLTGDKATKRTVEARVTYDMVRACIESRACVSFSAFGVSEKNDLLKSWFQTDSHSFMFDSRFRPKASFTAFRQALLKL